MFFIKSRRPINRLFERKQWFVANQIFGESAIKSEGGVNVNKTGKGVLEGTFHQWGQEPTE